MKRFVIIFTTSIKYEISVADFHVFPFCPSELINEKQTIARRKALAEAI